MSSADPCPFAAYAAGRVLDQDGWRDCSPDNIRQFYADLGYRNDAVTIDLTFTGADNRLFGGSATPASPR